MYTRWDMRAWKINPGLNFSSEWGKSLQCWQCPVPGAPRLPLLTRNGAVLPKGFSVCGCVKFNLSFYFGCSLPSAQLLLCNSCTELSLEEISRAVGSKSAWEVLFWNNTSVLGELLAVLLSDIPSDPEHNYFFRVIKWCLKTLEYAKREKPGVSH